jgi:hypothetical protein
VLVVDDGSGDASPVVLAGLRRDWPELRVVRLRRNCGHQAALTAGLHRARGAYVVSIDADLQDPPETIPAMLRLATWLGATGVLVCLALGVYVFASYLYGNTVSGWTSLFVALVFLGAVQLLCLGLLGEYVGRVYAAVQGRPAYFVEYDSEQTDVTVGANR